MKSIKEKAEEYENGFDVCHFGSHDMIKSYEAGANYVLECIELYCNEHVVCNNTIKHLIEQLKKK